MKFFVYFCGLGEEVCAEAWRAEVGAGSGGVLSGQRCADGAGVAGPGGQCLAYWQACYLGLL